MSLNLGTLLVQLRATTADFKNDMAEAKREVEKFTDNLKPIAAASTVAFGGLAASIALVTKAAGEDIVNEMRLKSVFGENAQALISLAEAQETATQFSKDASIEAMKLMGTMGASKDQVLALLPSVQDLAALMGSDLPSSAMTMMRAVDAGSGALRRSGLAMSEQQKATFDSLNSAGRMAMMMDLIREKAGGMAERMTTTVPGALEQVKNSLSSMTDELGMAFQGPAVEALNTLNGYLRDATTWFKALTPEAKETAAKIALVATGITGLIAGLSGLALAVPTLIAGFSAIGAAIGGAFLPAVAALVAVAAGIGVVLTLVGTFKKLYTETGFGEKAAMIYAWATGMSPEQAAEFAKGEASTGGPGVQSTGEYLKDAFAQGAGELKDSIGSMLGPLNAAFKDLLPTMEDLGTKADDAAGELGDIGPRAAEVARVNALFEEGADNLAQAHKSIAEMMEKLAKPKMGGSLGISFPQAGGGSSAGDIEREARVQEAMANIRYADVANSVNKMFGEVGLKLLESWDSVKGTIGDALSGFGKVFGATLLGSAGQLGETVNAAMQGFQSGGPWGAIAAVIASLLSKTQSFQDMISHTDEMLGGIIEALEPLMRSILPLIVLTNMLVSLIFSGLAPVFEGLGYVFEGLFYVVKYLALGVMYVVKGIGWAYNQIIEAAADLADYFWDAAGDEIRKAKLNQEYIDNLIEEWASMTPGHARAVAWASGQDDPTVPLEELGDAAGDAADDISGMTEQLTNVPEGFKVALARYHSISTEGRSGQIFGANTATQGGGFVNNGTIVVQANDPEEFERKLEEKRSWDNYRSNGSIIGAAPAYSGG